MAGFGIDGPLHRLDRARSTADDKDSLPFGVVAVKLGRVEDLRVEFLLVLQVRYFRVTAGSHGCNDTIKPAVAWVVDNPAALAIL